MLRDFQHFLISTFNASEDASATIITSLVVFAMGFFIRGLIVLVRSLINQVKIRKLFKMSLKYMTISALNQSRHFAALLSQTTSTSPTLIRYRINHIDITRVTEIGYQELHKACFGLYQSKFKYKVFQKLWDVLHTMSILESAAKSDIANYRDSVNRLNNKRSEQIGIIRELMDEMYFNFTSGVFESNSSVNTEYFTRSFEAYINWLNSQNSLDPKTQDEILVTPLLDINREYASQVALCQQFLTPLLEAQVYYKSLANQQYSFQVQCSSYRSTYKYFSQVYHIGSRTF